MFRTSFSLRSRSDQSNQALIGVGSFLKTKQKETKQKKNMYLFVVSLFRISIANATLKMTYCDYDRFLNANLIKSLDSDTFSSLSSLELV